MASLPVDFAKSRTWRGLTTTTGKPSTARVLTSGTSSSPVASRTFRLGRNPFSRAPLLLLFQYRCWKLATHHPWGVRRCPGEFWRRRSKQDTPCTQMYLPFQALSCNMRTQPTPATVRAPSRDWARRSKLSHDLHGPKVNFLRGLMFHNLNTRESPKVFVALASYELPGQHLANTWSIAGHYLATTLVTTLVTILPLRSLRGPATSASLAWLEGLVVDASGIMFIADTNSLYHPPSPWFVGPLKVYKTADDLQTFVATAFIGGRGGMSTRECSSPIPDISWNTNYRICRLLEPRRYFPFLAQRKIRTMDRKFRASLRSGGFEYLQKTAKAIGAVQR